jgi:integral membrane protein (TIGR01906 family)
VLYFALDFEGAFTQYHLVFFDNDKWILDPSMHVMIRMVPQEFFETSAAKLAVYTGAAWLMVIVVAASCTAATRRPKPKKEERFYAVS